MSRRNEHTKEELTQITLKQVHSFLKTTPYKELSLRKIAAMVGYAPSTLIKLFGSYDLLLLEVVIQSLDELTTRCEQVVQQHQEPIKAIQQLAYSYHDFAVENRYRWQLIFEHQIDGHKFPQHAHSQVKRISELLETQVSQLSDNLDVENISQMSRVLWAAVHGISVLNLEGNFFSKKPVDGHQLIDNFIKNYF